MAMKFDSNKLKRAIATHMAWREFRHNVRVHDGSPRRTTTDFRLFAIVQGWHEADVLGSTIANAFTQGCERVYYVDNDSPDGSLDAARAAGASECWSYATERFTPGAGIREMNRHVAEVSAAEDSPRIWWLYLDADEFPHGPDGMTVRELLSSIDESVRLVSSRVIDHLPSDRPTYLKGFHPADFQPLCYERFPRTRRRICAAGHFRHPLVRWDRDLPKLYPVEGYHRVRDAPPNTTEAAESIITHHFQYRDEADSLKRYEALRSRVSTDDTSHMEQRTRIIGSVYRGEWEKVPLRMSRPYPGGRPLVPWEEAVASADVAFARWYGPDELSSALAAWRTSQPHPDVT